MNGQNLYELIIAADLPAIVKQDRPTLRQVSQNRWDDPADTSFNVFKDPVTGHWLYHEFNCDQTGNADTYFRNYRGISDRKKIARELGINTDSTDKNYTTNYTKIWTTTPIQKIDETPELVEYHIEKVKQLSLFELTPVRENSATLDELEHKTKWLYNEPVAAEEKIIKKNGKTKKATLTIFAQRFKDKGNKKWRYIQKEKRLGGATEEHFCCNLDIAKNGTDVSIPEVTTSDVPFYLGELVQNSHYLLDCEGETDTDIAALYLGLNAVCEKKSLSHYQKQLPKLLKDKENIKLIIIFCDNDYAGLSYAKKKLQAYKEQGLACLVINSYTKKVVTKCEPTIDLPNYSKDENGKHSNDGKGYDLKDLILSFVNKSLSIPDVISELNLIINNAINELLAAPQKESETTDYQDFDGDDTVTVYYDDEDSTPPDDDDFADIWASENSAPSESIATIENVKTELNIKDILRIFKVKKDISNIKQVKIYLNSEDLTKENSKPINGVLKIFRENKVDYICHLKGYGIIAKNNKLNPMLFMASDLIKLHFKYTPDIILNEQYLSGKALLDAVGADNIFGKVIAIKSGLGTNKTGAFLELINNPIFKDYGCLILNDINRLGKQTVARSMVYERNLNHLQSDLKEDEKPLFVSDSMSSLVLCFNSLSRFSDEDLENRIVIIDEVMAVIETLKIGNTCQGNSKEDKFSTQQKLYQKLRECLKRAAAVIILDGNVTDENVKLISSLANKKEIKIENKPLEKKHYHFNIGDDWNTLVAQAFDDLAIGKKVAITSDSLTELRRIKELILKDNLLSPDEIVLAGQDSTKQEAPPEFFTNPDNYLEKNNIKLLMYSPSMGRGFDIQWTGFDTQYCYFCGVLPIEQCEQQVIRIRDNTCERFMSVDEKMFNQNDGFSRDFIYQKIIETLDKMPDDREKNSVNRMSLIAKYFADDLTSYGIYLDTFISKYSDKLDVFLPLFFLSKGHSLNFLNLTKDTTIKDKKEAIKQEQKTALDKQVKESVATLVSHSELISESQANEKTLKEIKEKLANPVLLNEEAKHQLLEQQKELKEKQDNLADTLANNEIKLAKFEKLIPKFRESELKENKDILTLFCNGYLKENYLDFILLTCIKNDISLEHKFKQQIYNFTKSARLYGSVWLNGLNKTSVILSELKKIGAKDILKYLDGLSFGSDEIEKYIDFGQIDKNWNDEVFGEKPKTRINQVKRILEMVGYSLESKTKKGYAVYSLIPTICKALRKEDGTNTISKETAASFYQLAIESLSDKFTAPIREPRFTTLEKLDEHQNYAQVEQLHRETAIKDIRQSIYTDDVAFSTNSELPIYIEKRECTPLEKVNISLFKPYQPTSLMYSLENFNEILQYF